MSTSYCFPIPPDDTKMFRIGTAVNIPIRIQDGVFSNAKNLVYISCGTQRPDICTQPILKKVLMENGNLTIKGTFYDGSRMLVQYPDLKKIKDIGIVCKPAP